MTPSTRRRRRRRTAAAAAAAALVALAAAAGGAHAMPRRLVGGRRLEVPMGHSEYGHRDRAAEEAAAAPRRGEAPDFSALDALSPGEARGAPAAAPRFMETAARADAKDRRKVGGMPLSEINDISTRAVDDVLKLMGMDRPGEDERFAEQRVGDAPPAAAAGSLLELNEQYSGGRARRLPGRPGRAAAAAAAKDPPVSALSEVASAQQPRRFAAGVAPPADGSDHPERSRQPSSKELFDTFSRQLPKRVYGPRIQLHSDAGAGAGAGSAAGGDAGRARFAEAGARARMQQGAARGYHYKPSPFKHPPPPPVPPPPPPPPPPNFGEGSSFSGYRFVKTGDAAASFVELASRRGAPPAAAAAAPRRPAEAKPAAVQGLDDAPTELEAFLKAMER